MVSVRLGKVLAFQSAVTDKVANTPEKAYSELESLSGGEAGRV